MIKNILNIILTILYYLLTIIAVIINIAYVTNLYNDIYYYYVENCSATLNIKFFTYPCALSSIILNICMFIMRVYNDIIKIIIIVFKIIMT